MVVSINGTHCSSTNFDWLRDSGFRYGYGCFETMRMINGKLPLFDKHEARLNRSLNHFGINYSSVGLQERVLALLSKLKQPTGICQVHVTAGPLHMAPGFTATPTEIISHAPLPSSSSWNWCFFPISPHEFYQHKSMAYAHHIHALSKCSYWPIYTDSADMIIDSSIFSLGFITANTITFAKHDYQLPSVSRQVITESWQYGGMTHKPITTNDWLASDVRFGCNAVRGVFELKTPDEPSRPEHPLIEKMNRCLGF